MLRRSIQRKLAKQYDSIVRKKQQIGELSKDKSWKDDTSETARRVWEFWRMETQFSLCFQSLKLLAVLVVIIQISSASVERVFSQLKQVLETTQDSALKDVIVCRIMERINNRMRKKQLVPSFDCLLTDKLVDDSDLAFDDIIAECLEELLSEDEDEQENIDFYSHLDGMDKEQGEQSVLEGVDESMLMDSDDD